MNNNQNIEDIVSRLETAVKIIESSAIKSPQDERDCYRQELENAVAVLKQTKGAFHSKQLKNLRERIEHVLHKFH